MLNNGYQSLVEDFVSRLTIVLEQELSARLRGRVLAALGAPEKRGPGRPPKHSFGSSTALAVVRPRRPLPRQLCPVPGCKNPAAPIYGMVCGEHKDVAKSKIAAYRKARKEAKEEAKQEAKTGARAKAAPSARKRRAVHRKAPRRISAKQPRQDVQKQLTAAAATASAPV